MGDGNGWTRCALGHRHWGLFGAAGLLVTDRGDVLLQHRAAWTHEGDTWALPGGARDSSETAVEAALREAAEETSLDLCTVQPVAAWTDDHRGWSYTTIVAVTTARAAVSPANAESCALRWWAFDEVAGLRLHHGFALAWPHLRGLIEDCSSSLPDPREQRPNR